MKDFHKFTILLKLATNNNKNVLFKNFKSDAKGLMKNDKIGISDKLDLKEATKTLAHELAHTYLHYDKGDTIASDKHKEYEEQANRTMNLIMDLLDAI